MNNHDLYPYTGPAIMDAFYRTIGVETQVTLAEIMTHLPNETEAGVKEWLDWFVYEREYLGVNTGPRENFDPVEVQERHGFTPVPYTWWLRREYEGHAQSWATAHEALRQAGDTWW